MVVGTNSNSRPGPSSQKRKKQVKPAVKTLLDFRKAGKKSTLSRDSYASEDSESDGTPPPSILTALARRGVGNKPKDTENDKGKGTGKAKGNGIAKKRPKQCTEVIELSDSDSSIKRPPKKRARITPKESHNDVIDLCSDDEGRPRSLKRQLSTSNDVLVLSGSDDEPIAAPEVSTSSPKKGNNSTRPHPQVSNSSPIRHRETIYNSPSSFPNDENPLEQSVAPEGSRKRKRLTQQDFIAAYKSSESSSVSISSSSLRAHIGSQTGWKKTYSIRYSDVGVVPPLLTQTLFSRTIEVMKAQHRLTHRAKSITFNPGGTSFNVKLQPTDNPGSSSIDAGLLTAACAQAEVEKQSGSEAEHHNTNIDAVHRGPSHSAHKPEKGVLTPSSHPAPGSNQEVEVKAAASDELRNQGSLLRRSLSVLQIDVSQLTASIILDSVTEGDTDVEEDDTPLSDLELAYPEPWE